MPASSGFGGTIGSSSMVGVQGNVPYRVSLSQIRPHITTELNSFVERSHIVMFFNIGELEVSANREEIRYDQKSVDAIVARIKRVYEEFTYEVENMIGDVNDKYWYACLELNTLSKSLFGHEDAIRKFVNHEKITDENLKRYIKDDGKVNITRLWGYDFNTYRHSGYHKNAKFNRSAVPRIIVPEYDILIVINDVKTGGIKRLSNFLKNNQNYSRVFVLTELSEPAVEFDDENNPIEYCGYEKELERLEEELGHPEIKLVSEVTTELEKKTVSRDLTFYVYSSTYSSRRNYYGHDKIKWEQTDCNLEDGGLYFPLKFRSTPCFVDKNGKLRPLGFNDCDFTLCTLRFLIDAYNAENGTNYTINTVIAMPSAATKKARKMSNWVDLLEYAKLVLPGFVEEISYHKRWKATSSALEIKHAIKDTEFVKQIKKLDDTSSFKQTIMPLIEGMEKSRDDVMAYASNIEHLFHVLFPEREIDNTAFYENTAFKKYPMLSMVNTVSGASNWPTLLEYIKMVDRSKK